MQVNSTLIAAQQAAREAQAKFQATHISKPAFAAALANPGDFSPLPLKQAPTQAPAMPQGSRTAQPGGLLDITI